MSHSSSKSSSQSGSGLNPNLNLETNADEMDSTTLATDPSNLTSGSARGTVKWFNNSKGYGFIQIESDLDLNLNTSDPSENIALTTPKTSETSSSEVFAHFSQIIMNGYRTLKPGDAVSFEINEGPKGLNAKNIQPLFKNNSEN